MNFKKEIKYHNGQPVNQEEKKPEEIKVKDLPELKPKKEKKPKKVNPQSKLF